MPKSALDYIQESTVLSARKNSVIVSLNEENSDGIRHRSCRRNRVRPDFLREQRRREEE